MSKSYLYILTIFCLSIPNTSIAQTLTWNNFAFFDDDDLDSLQTYIDEGYLIYYDLSGRSGLTSLPEAVMQIPVDQFYGFSCLACELKALPKDFFMQFTNLKSIVFKNYENISFPFPEIFELEKLEVLEITGFRFSEVPSIKSLNLKDLWFDSPFRTFPKAILELENLQVLELRGCMFDTIPNSIRNLKALQRLRIEGSFKSKDTTILTKIPESIGALKNLLDFSLTYANIKTLPSNLFDLPKLNSLTLLDSGIEYFPENMRYNDSLAYIFIAEGSQFKGFPQALLDFKLEYFTLIIKYPSIEFFRNRPLLFAFQKNVKNYSEQIENLSSGYERHFSYENPEFTGAWKVFESSSDTLELQLIPELDALTGQYFICQEASSLVASYYDEDVKRFSADLMFTLEKKGNIFYGEVQSSIAVLFQHKYKGYPLCFQAEMNETKDIMTITNSAGVVYKLKPFKS